MNLSKTIIQNEGKDLESSIFITFLHQINNPPSSRSPLDHSSFWVRNFCWASHCLPTIGLEFLPSELLPYPVRRMEARGSASRPSEALASLVPAAVHSHSLISGPWGGRRRSLETRIPQRPVGLQFLNIDQSEKLMKELYYFITLEEKRVLLPSLGSLHRRVGLTIVFVWGFPGGSVVKNPPASAGNMGSIPSLGKSHGLRSNWAHARRPLSLYSKAWSCNHCAHSLQLLIPGHPRVRAPQREQPPQREA